MKGTGFRCAAALALVACLSGCATVLSATRDDDHRTLARLLRGGANADEASRNGTTPLFVAVEASNVPVAKMLLDAGADVNKPSHCRGLSVTPVQKAAIHGDVGMVRLLLERGADPTILSPSHVFTLMAFDREPRDARAIADAVVENVRIKKGQEAVTKFLDAQQPNGWTPLAAAAWTNDTALIDALLAHGATVDARAGAATVDDDNKDEWPPLLFAMLHENRGAYERLLKAGADPSAKTLRGKTGDEVIADIEQRREEASARRREEQREEEAQSRRNFALFQQGMQTVAAGVKAGIDEAHETRRQQEQALENLRRAREERAARESEAAREAHAEHRREAATSPTDASRPPSSTVVPATDTDQEAKKRADEDAKKKADSEAAKTKAWEEYVSSLKKGMRARATTGYPACAGSPKEYCVVPQWPAGVRAPSGGANLAEVDFRARCRGGAESWQSGHIDHVSPPPASVVPAYLQPKPNCPVSDVEVEVTDVTPSR